MVEHQISRWIKTCNKFQEIIWIIGKMRLITQIRIKDNKMQWIWKIKTWWLIKHRIWICFRRRGELEELGTIIASAVCFKVRSQWINGKHWNRLAHHTQASNVRMLIQWIKMNHRKLWAIRLRTIPEIFRDLLNHRILPRIFMPIWQMHISRENMMKEAIVVGTSTLPATNLIIRNNNK